MWFLVWAPRIKNPGYAYGGTQLVLAKVQMPKKKICWVQSKKKMEKRVFVTAMWNGFSPGILLKTKKRRSSQFGTGLRATHGTGRQWLPTPRSPFSHLQCKIKKVWRSEFSTPEVRMWNVVRHLSSHVVEYKETSHAQTVKKRLAQN